MIGKQSIRTSISCRGKPVVFFEEFDKVRKGFKPNQMTTFFHAVISQYQGGGGGNNLSAVDIFNRGNLESVFKFLTKIGIIPNNNIFVLKEPL